MNTRQMNGPLLALVITLAIGPATGCKQDSPNGPPPTGHSEETRPTPADRPSGWLPSRQMRPTILYTRTWHVSERYRC